MSLLFCMMAWSWLRKLVRGYCSAGSFIAPPNRNRFLMLAGLLMSVVYGMVDDDCDDIFSSAIDVCCIWYGLLMSVVYWSFSWNEQGHDCSPWSSWIRSWDAVPSIWWVCIMGSIKRLNWYFGSPCLISTAKLGGGEMEH